MQLDLAPKREQREFVLNYLLVLQLLHVVSVQTYYSQAAAKSYWGFGKGIKISISVYSIYSLARATSAYASDSCPDPGTIVPAGPENNGALKQNLDINL